MESRYRRYALLAALAALVVLAGCAGTTSQQDTERVIEVTANGEASGEPDRATLAVAVESTGTDPTAVRRTLAERDTALRAALADRGINDTNIQTSQYDIRQRRTEGPDGEASQEPYVGIHRYTVQVTAVDEVGAVIDTAIGAGADRVERVQFGLSKSRERTIRAAALEEAMGAARDEATVLASNANLTLRGVSTVSTTNVQTSPYTTRAVQAEAADTAVSGAETGVEPGSVDVTVTVRVVFEAAPA